MKASSIRAQGVRAACLGLVALVVLGASAAGAAGDPDFGAVPWVALDCAPGGDPVGDESPSQVDIVGDAAHPATYYAYDAKYLYFRYRLDANPAIKGGYSEGIWSALMQVPAGNARQYQYEIAVNGKSDDLELWANTSARDLAFTPNFNDPAETLLFGQGVNAANGSTVNSTPLVRSVPADSAFGGSADYFLDFAMPISVLVANGAVAGAGDLPMSLFAPATSSTVNNFNKDHLECGFLGDAAFLPSGNLSVTATLEPDNAAPNVTTSAGYSITVHNDGPAPVKGLVIDGSALPDWMGNVSAVVSSGATVDSLNPLKVEVPFVAAGSTVTVHLTFDAQPTCKDDDFTWSITASAANAAPVTYGATLAIDRNVHETCDGVDNDCDGKVDGDATCDDGNACTVDSCHGTGGCTHEAIAGCQPCTTASDCDSGNACTTETCDAGRCVYQPISGCQPCATASDCTDGNACTTESCNAGRCAYDTIAGCQPCTTASDCNDRNACTTESCNAGRCAHDTIGGCEPCTTVSDCDDGNACTTETCNAGRCGHAVVADCTPSPTKPVEICGDCIDNDGDGLVDWEDPDCCEQLIAMQPQRVMLKRPTAKGRNRMRVKAIYSYFTPVGFDPNQHDTSLQISDGAGQVVCATVPAGHWMRPTPRRFSFCDKDGTFAGGLRDGRFVKRKSGRVIFRAVSRKFPNRPIDGTSVRITVRVGNQCSQSTMGLRAKKKALVYP